MISLLPGSVSRVFRKGGLPSIVQLLPTSPVRCEPPKNRYSFQSRWTRISAETEDLKELIAGRKKPKPQPFELVAVNLTSESDLESELKEIQAEFSSALKDLEGGGPGSGRYPKGSGQHSSNPKVAITVRTKPEWGKNRRRLEFKIPQGKGHLSMVDFGDHFQVSSSEVSKNLRGKGFGRALYNRAIEVARNEGKKEIRSDASVSDSAVRMWVALGATRQHTDFGTQYVLPIHPGIQADYDPSESRDESGKWSKEGGAGEQQPLEKMIAPLKAKWSNINNKLLDYLDTPTHPDVQQAMNEMKQVVQEMNQLRIHAIETHGKGTDVVVVGAGPGGLSSSIMGAADGLHTMVIESQPQVGGQARYSSRIENYPGFPVGIAGAKLASNMYEQATRLGADVQLGVRVTGLEYHPETGLKTVTLSDGRKIEAKSVILAGGVEFAKIPFPGSESPDVVYGNGQMLHDRYANKPVVVLGGSNGAAQAALGCATTASKVYLLSRSPLEKSMSDYQVQAVRNNPKIQVIENDTIAKAFLDDHQHIQKVETKSGKQLDASAVGVFLGSAPKTDWLPPAVEKQEGKIKTDINLETGIPGVFAIGDIRAGSIGRIGAAVGDGQMAERNVFSYFERMPKKGTEKAVAAATEEDHRKMIHELIESLFELDKNNPEPLSQSVEKEDRDVEAFDPSEARDSSGKWTAGDEITHLTATKQRAFTGSPVPVKTTLSKLETGALGESVVIAYLKQNGMTDARHLNAKVTNFPVDLVQDSGAIEVKAGLVSNGVTAQQWRATIGQPGHAESEWLKTASKEEKHHWNEMKAQKILDRKNAELKDLSKQLGHTVEGSTMASIINPDTRTLDLYKFPGFHLRIPWNSPQAQEGYVGSFKF